MPWKSEIDRLVNRVIVVGQLLASSPEVDRVQ